METIEEFYQEHKDESQLTSLLGVDISGFTDETLLKKALPPTLPQLKKLCNDDITNMVETLQLFISLPRVRGWHKVISTDRRAEERKRDQVERRVKGKIQKKISLKLKVAQEFFPGIDFDGVVENTNDLIDETTREDWPNLVQRSEKVDRLFNIWITLIFWKSKQSSTFTNNAIHTLIAKILASLKITNTVDKEYHREDIRHILERSHPPT